MRHPIYGDNWYRQLNRENDYRPYLIGEDTSPGYRFGSYRGARVRAGVRGVVRGFGRVFRFMHEALLASQMRRAERELQLRSDSARSRVLRRGIGT